MPERIKPSRILETLVRNAQKGEPYRLKLDNDPIVYEGIPISTPGATTPGATTPDKDAFRLDVTSPPEKAGLVHGRIHDIEWLERVSG